MPKLKKPDIKKHDAEIMPMSTIEGYHPNTFPNRRARRQQAKRMGVIKQFKRYNNSRGENVQTMRKEDGSPN